MKNSSLRRGIVPTKTTELSSIFQKAKDMNGSANPGYKTTHEERMICGIFIYNLKNISLNQKKY